MEQVRSEPANAKLRVFLFQLLCVNGDWDRALSQLNVAGELDAGTPVMIYACGPEGMLAATSRIARRHGRPCEVSVERIMGCGMGGCYSCVVPMRGEHGSRHHVRSCLAGPVLPADQIVWD